MATSTAKTKRLFHFTSARYGLEALRDNRLKVARIEELNDPFEFFGIAVDRDGRRELTRFKSAYDKEFGVVCLSADWKHPLLWGHYADKHRGIALGFDVYMNIAVEIDYLDRRLTLEEFGLRSLHDLDEKSMLRLLTMKFKAWEYEAEWRLHVALKDKDTVSDLYFVEFGPQMRLAEVIIGDRSTVTRGRLKNVLGLRANEIRTFKARPGFKSFEVVENNLKDAWKA